MLLHQMVNSDEERIVRKIIVTQIEEERAGKAEENWFTAVKKWAKKLDIEIDVDELKELTKNEWKRLVKDKMEAEISNEVKEKAKTLTKLRFVQKFEKQEYLKRFSISTVKKIMKIRLNMVEVSENFRGRFENETCAACHVEKETTEHVIRCKEYRKITGHTIADGDNNDCFGDTEWLKMAAEVYERIEETRKLIC
jgi:hypothetical protein